MKNLPSDRSEVTIWHTIAHYTFLPVLALGLLGGASPLPLYYFGVLGISSALSIPWVSIGIVIVYVSLLGDYVMPAETYRKYCSGEWGDA